MKNLTGIILMVMFAWSLSLKSSSADLLVGGAIEFDYSYTAPEEGGSVSDFTLSTLDVTLDATLNDYFSTAVILTANEENGIDLDEGYITVRNNEKTPLYVIMGIYTLPFGQFYTHTASDPMTQIEHCEVVDTGMTLGAEFTSLMNLDFSVTGFRADREETQDEESLDGVIFKAAIAPVDGLSCGVGLKTDDVDDRINAFFEIVKGRFTVDADYFKVTRTDAVEEEQLYAVGLACQCTSRTEIAARYEARENASETDDDSGAAIFHDEFAGVLGANFKLYDNVTLLGEYKYIDMDVTEANQVTLRCALEF